MKRLNGAPVTSSNWQCRKAIRYIFGWVQTFVRSRKPSHRKFSASITNLRLTTDERSNGRRRHEWSRPHTFENLKFRRAEKSACVASLIGKPAARGKFRSLFPVNRTFNATSCRPLTIAGDYRAFVGSDLLCLHFKNKLRVAFACEAFHSVQELFPAFSFTTRHSKAGRLPAVSLCPYSWLCLD